MRPKFLLLFPILILLLVFSCKPADNKNKRQGPLQIVTTTSMITEMVSEIGGSAVQVQGLMGAGVDPHLYKASEGDVNKLFQADMVFYNGLHLEGKLVEVFENMERQHITMVAVSDTIKRDSLISSKLFASNYDPHIWFDISIWKAASAYVAKKLEQVDPANSAQYRNNLLQYQSKLDSLEEIIRLKINELPVEDRILITAHDAFNYFGKAYGFEVMGLQGISTATEAGVQDVQLLASLIVERKIKAVFIESSVPKRNIEALQEAVRSKGFEVVIGGMLFSDALGNTGTAEGTYTGMFLHNVNTIVDALKK
jgi:manganese/zinc/iron transport system substrate-binding protein